MTNDATEEKLRTMKLTGMLSSWNEQRATPKSDEMSFDERFGLIVDAEELCRETRRLGRTLKQAKLKITAACVEGIDGATVTGDRRHSSPFSGTTDPRKNPVTGDQSLSPISVTGNR